MKKKNYRTLKNCPWLNEEYNHFRIYPMDTIQEISSMDPENLDPISVYYLLDTLREVLIHYGLLSEESRLIDEGEIDVSQFTHHEMSKTLRVILDEITAIMHVNGILG